MTTETETIAPEWPFKIKLRKPIVSADGELQELSLREPTAGDLAQAGVPVVIDFSGDARAERRSSQKTSRRSSLQRLEVDFARRREWYGPTDRAICRFPLARSASRDALSPPRPAWMVRRPDTQESPPCLLPTQS
jgi:hypothetical protein